MLLRNAVAHTRTTGRGGQSIDIQGDDNEKRGGRGKGAGGGIKCMKRS